MKNVATYAEKLRDPRWQKRRLEIMSRDSFACRHCDDADSTLNVHHRWYAAKRDPWGYPDAALITLCEECHADANENDALGRETLLTAVCESGEDFSGVADLVRFIDTKGMTVADAIWIFKCAYEQQEVS